MKKIFILTCLCVGSLIGFSTLLKNGAFIRFLDEHPDPRWVPSVEYYVGGGYYLFHNLQQAATYYFRIPERYPQSPLADDSYWAYLNALDDNAAVPRAALIEAYGSYIERYPNGQHIERAQNKFDSYKSGSR